MKTKLATSSIGRSRVVTAFFILAISGLHTRAAEDIYATEFLPITIERAVHGTKAFLNGEMIVEFSRDNRFLRFRSSASNDLWVGEERNPIDLCWAYTDKGINDFEFQSIETRKDRDSFEITIKAYKPSLTGEVRVVLRGRWLPQQEAFEYYLESRLNCPLENFYLKTEAPDFPHGLDFETANQIEAIDWRINQIWKPGGKSDSAELYDWFVYSHDRVKWTKSPKIHIIFATRRETRQGVYPTIWLCKLKPGGVLGFIDNDLGGWLVYPESRDPEQVHEFGLCWLAFDVHFYLPEGVPARKSCETLDLNYLLHFVPVPAADGNEITHRASEVDWRNLEEYQLPVLKLRNDFRDLISGRGDEYMWHASDFACFRDDTTGYDDDYSVSIKKTDAGPSAWYASSWRHVDQPLEGSYRIRAMVRTEKCNGWAGIGVVKNSIKEWGVYGTTWPGKGNSGIEWIRSKRLTGDNDWSEVTLDVVVKPGDRTPQLIVLEQDGTGQTWFDNVLIEDLP